MFGPTSSLRAAAFASGAGDLRGRYAAVMSLFVREASRKALLQATLVVLTAGIVSAGCCIPRSYGGDGDFTDRCRSGRWHFWARDRYVLDLGAVDLSEASEASFSLGGLPKARMWLLGLDVEPRPDRPQEALLFEAILQLHMTTVSGTVVISERASLDRWQWERSMGTKEGIGPSFVYRAGDSRDISIGDGAVRVEATGVKAHGGWGTYFEPTTKTPHRLTIRVVEPDPDARYFDVRLLAVGSNYGGSL
jgi:hypothetical protein